MLCYRVECFDNEKNETVGGYHSIITIAVADMLGMSDSILKLRDKKITDTEYLTEQCSKIQELPSELKSVVRKITDLGYRLSDIPVPPEEIYPKYNGEETFCLYNKWTFLCDEIYDLQELERLLKKYWKHGNVFEFIVKKYYINIAKTDILYCDDYQVIISKSRYKRGNENREVIKLKDMKGI